MPSACGATAGVPVRALLIPQSESEMAYVVRCIYDLALRLSSLSPLQSRCGLLHMDMLLLLYNSLLPLFFVLRLGVVNPHGRSVRNPVLPWISLDSSV